MPASAVSSPTASTRTRIAESVDTVPATTRSPGRRGTGRDSPVIIDSSSSASPSTIAPVGRHPPARAHQHDVADGRSAPIGDALDRAVRADHARPRRGAARPGPRARPAAWPMAFISCQWPSSMMVTSAASSHQNSRSNHPRLRGHRRRPRHGDGHGDQQHHARRAGRGSPARRRPGTATRPRANTNVPSTGPTHADAGRAGSRTTP